MGTSRHSPHRPTVEIEGEPLSQSFPVHVIELEVLSGEMAGETVRTERPNLRVGADSACDLALREPTVSRNHAELRVRGRSVLLVDLDSTNGTYMPDGRRVHTEPLRSGQRFRVGAVELEFHLHTEHVELPEERLEHDYEGIVGRSPEIREILRILDRVAPSELSVVIEGETGTGKEVITRALHEHSNRKDGPLIVFDCSAFPPTLLESELFGHEKGAFTGAVSQHRGVFERAHEGTLFLDELGEMELESQAKLLRALETGTIRRVGGEDPIQVDVRVVAATNRNLEKMVGEREFRSDLFYRLAQVRFLLPPLRERRDDIAPLTHHFLDAHAARSGRRPSLEPGALEALKNYPWPGNIRELRNFIEKSVAMSSDGHITRDFVERELRGLATRRRALIGELPASASPPTADAPAAPEAEAQIEEPGHTLRLRLYEKDRETLRPFKQLKEQVIDEFERAYLLELLDRVRLNISEVAREAGVDRRHIYRLVRKHDIDIGLDD